MTTTERFRKVYADAIIHNMTKDQWDVASKDRELHWKGSFIPLAEAAPLYALIVDGYNEFQPDMLPNLLEAFSDVGIEAAPARESSVAVYLKIPAKHREVVEKYIRDNWEADDIDWQTDETLRIWWD